MGTAIPFTMICQIFQGYLYTWERFVRDDIGKNRIVTLKKSDIRRYYNKMIDERGLKFATVDCIHTVMSLVTGPDTWRIFIGRREVARCLIMIKSGKNTGMLPERGS